MESYTTDISLTLAQAAHAGTSFVPERRALQVQIDYDAHLQHIREKMRAYETDDAMRTLVAAQFERYRAGYRKHYSALLGAQSRTMSTMIAGPSNFPVRRMEKRNRTVDNRRADLLKWQERAWRAIARILRKATAADPVEEMRAKLAKAEKFQEQAKGINAIIRKKKLSDDERVAELMRAFKLPEPAARELLKPDFAGRVGIPDYSLRNNLANIKRMRGRLAELEAKEQARESARGTEAPAREFQGGRVVENVEDDRLQIFFDAKPADNVRDILKSNGFRWAPSAGAWQRQLTGNARHAATQILNRLELI